MTCTARMPSPLVLHKEPLVLVRKDDPIWNGMPKLAPTWRFTTGELIRWSGCMVGIGFALGFITLALLISFYGVAS